MVQLKLGGKKEKTNFCIERDYPRRWRTLYSGPTQGFPTFLLPVRNRLKRYLKSPEGSGPQPIQQVRALSFQDQAARFPTAGDNDLRSAGPLWRPGLEESPLRGQKLPTEHWGRGRDGRAAGAVHRPAPSGTIARAQSTGLSPFSQWPPEFGGLGRATARPERQCPCRGAAGSWSRWPTAPGEGSLPSPATCSQRFLRFLGFLNSQEDSVIRRAQQKQAGLRRGKLIKS